MIRIVAQPNPGAQVPETGQAVDETGRRFGGIRFTGGPARLLLAAKTGRQRRLVRRLIRLLAGPGRRQTGRQLGRIVSILRHATGNRQQQAEDWPE